MAADVPLPLDIRLMNGAATTLFVGVVVALLAALLMWLARSPGLNLRAIQLDGDLQRNSVATIRANVMPRLRGNFFSMDLDKARDAFEAVPWVRQATLRRIWPNRLAVRLSEHQPAALWQGEQSPQQDKSEVSDTEQFSHLKTLSFFRNFPENELWEVLKISKWRPFPAGTMLISEGDVGDSFFILAQGNVKVTRGKRLLNVLGAGDCFGEMSYLAKRDGPRSASITTATDCIVMKVRAADLNNATPSCRRLFDRKFLETLVERLETANQQLAVT